MEADKEQEKNWKLTEPVRKKLAKGKSLNTICKELGITMDVLSAVLDLIGQVTDVL